MSEPPKLKFESKEEFRKICQSLSARLGYLNRVAMGEQSLVVDLSQALLEIGRIFEQDLDDPEIRKAFGDGYVPGTLSREERRARLAQMLFEPQSKA